MTDSAPVRVRIAPSPTGDLHLGTVRTALFNYLFAKKEGGAFIVRIEDTDRERSLPIYEGNILDGLKKTGVLWDEGPDIGGPYGPYRQSERENIYKGYLEKLLEEKRAYWCFCSKEDLEEERKAMLSQGMAPRYGGKCRNFSDEERSEKLKEGQSAVIRLSVPLGLEVDFSDMVRGKISVNSDIIGDFVIARNLLSPLYNFAVVIDDELMKISHVIRGEDHISNTPKQILIQRALGFQEPKYAHLPLVLTPDRKKLSKRELETSFEEYIRGGYLPEALVNFLVLLGWHPEDDQELMTLEEVFEKFNLRRVQKGGAVFDLEKLNWFNFQHMKRLSLEELSSRVMEFIPIHWRDQKKLLKKALSVERERMKTLADFKNLAAFFFEIGEYELEMISWKDMPLSKVKDNLEEARKVLAAMSEKDFSKEKLETALLPASEKLGRGELFWPLRVALSGLRNSPGPFEIMEVLGKEKTLERIQLAISRLE